MKNLTSFLLLLGTVLILVLSSLVIGRAIRPVPASPYNWRIETADERNLAVDSYPDTGAVAGYGGTGARFQFTDRLAQTFIPRTSGVLDRVTVRLSGQGNPGTLTLAITETSFGRPSGVCLATASINVNGLTTLSAGEDVTVGLSSLVHVKIGITYAVVLTHDAVCTGWNATYWTGRASGGYTGGDRLGYSQGCWMVGRGDLYFACD